MDKIIMWILAFGALAGGLDCILGNRFGLGKKFEEGFHLLGPTALSMAGILCLIPLLTRLLSSAAQAICIPLGLDPAILGGLIAVDMGGYQLAHSLAMDIRIGNFAGVCIAAILGCTITFTIPVGMGMIRDEARSDFAQGILFGLISIPLSLLCGGLICGLSFAQTFIQGLPILLLSGLILLGMWKKTAQMIRGFSLFSRCISILTTIGLMLAAFEYISGFTILPGLSPIEESMQVVSSIGVVALGSLPMAEILQRLLRRPLDWFGAKTKLNHASVTGLFICMVSVLPAIALVKDMDRRGRIINAAFMVCAASAFAAHLGFVASVDPSMLGALLISKLAGGLFGAILALFLTRRMV